MITNAQIDHFNTKGFVVIENLIDDKALQGIRREYFALMDRLYDDWAAQGLVKPATDEMDFWQKLDQCYQGNFDWYQPFDISLPHDGITTKTPMHFGPAIFDIVRHKNILDTIEALIGPEITSNPIQHVRIKPPQRAVPQSEHRAHIVSTDWHQDMGVTLPEANKTQMVTVWLAVTDATIENGCLQVSDGAYDALLPHCQKNQVVIPDQFLASGTTTPLPVKAGGAVLFHPLTPHCSLPNNSDEYRWSFDLRYNVTGQATGRSQFPEFIARSKTHPDSALDDWQKWRDMWQAARDHEANVEHISQHRWGNDAPYCA